MSLLNIGLSFVLLITKDFYYYVLTGPGCNRNPAICVNGKISLPHIGGFSIRPLKELKYDTAPSLAHIKCICELVLC